MTEASSSAIGPWWEPREVQRDHGLSMCFGPLDLGILRRRGEWQLTHSSLDCSFEEEVDRVRVEPLDAVGEDLEIHERYAVDDRCDSLRCLPMAADRPVVVRPRLPFFVTPGQEVRIFVSTPVWIRVELGKPWRTLRELPARRLSDTWFGAPTDQGGLAYALLSNARVRREELPERYHRAITPIVIRNRADTVLPIDRLSLPVPYLSLLATPQHRLWTEAVTMTRTEDTELAALDIRKGAPPEAADARLVSKPRLVSESNLLVRAFTNLFGHSTAGEPG